MTSLKVKYPAIAKCEEIMELLDWSWQTPRIRVWFGKVHQRFYGGEVKDFEVLPKYIFEVLPEQVFVTLAQFLDWRFRCQELLVYLGSTWEAHLYVKKLEQKYGCTGALPLAGYKELWQLLDDQQTQDLIDF